MNNTKQPKKTLSLIYMPNSLNDSHEDRFSGGHLTEIDITFKKKEELDNQINNFPTIPVIPVKTIMPQRSEFKYICKQIDNSLAATNSVEVITNIYDNRYNDFQKICKYYGVFPNNIKTNQTKDSRNIHNLNHQNKPKQQRIWSINNLFDQNSLEQINQNFYKKSLIHNVQCQNKQDHKNEFGSLSLPAQSLKTQSNERQLSSYLQQQPKQTPSDLLIDNSHNLKEKKATSNIFQNSEQLFQQNRQSNNQSNLINLINGQAIIKEDSNNLACPLFDLNYIESLLNVTNLSTQIINKNPIYILENCTTIILGSKIHETMKIVMAELSHGSFPESTQSADNQLIIPLKKEINTKSQNNLTSILQTAQIFKHPSFTTIPTENSIINGGAVSMKNAESFESTEKTICPKQMQKEQHDIKVPSKNEEFPQTSLKIEDMLQMEGSSHKISEPTHYQPSINDSIKCELNMSDNSLKSMNYAAHCRKMFNLNDLNSTQLSQFRFSQYKKNNVKTQQDDEVHVSKFGKFHNFNKLFMYNILNMFQTNNLNNLNVPEIIQKELYLLISRIKNSAKNNYKVKGKYAFDYFSHAHYNVLFLHLTPENIPNLTIYPEFIELYQICFHIDLNQPISPLTFSYANIIKLFCFQIFLKCIQGDQIQVDSSLKQENLKNIYTLKVIKGIKKLAAGIIIKRF